MRSIVITVLLLAATLAGAVDKKGTIEELKQRLEKASPKDRVELAVVIAQRQLAAAEDAYKQGNAEQAQAALADVSQYGVLAAQESGQSRKRMKHTEIDLRKIGERLEALARSVDFDSRQPVKEAQKKLEAARNDLLFRMFK